MNKKDFDTLYKFDVLFDNQFTNYLLYNICCILSFMLLKLSGVILILAMCLMIIFGSMKVYIAFKRLNKLVDDVI